MFRNKVRLSSARKEIMIHFASFTLIGTRIAFLGNEAISSRGGMPCETL